MRNPHVFREGPVMYYLVGFIIAIAVGLTGIGGGSFTVPALVLLTGLTAGEPVRNRATGRSFGGVIKRDLYQARAKSRVRWKEPSLAPVARSADWNGIGIFVRRCWGARNGSSAELF